MRRQTEQRLHQMKRRTDLVPNHLINLTLYFLISKMEIRALFQSCYEDQIRQNIGST